MNSFLQRVMEEAEATGLPRGPRNFRIQLYILVKRGTMERSVHSIYLQELRRFLGWSLRFYANELDVNNACYRYTEYGVVLLIFRKQALEVKNLAVP